MILRAAALALMLGAPAQAQNASADAARRAAEMLEQAAIGLDAAEGRNDRVAALTETVKAYESGLEAMRDGLRAVTIREQTLSRKLDAQDGEIARLLGVLQAIGRSEGPTLLLHPSGPMGTARAGMLLADVTPALQSQAQALKADLDEVSTLRLLQEDAANRLRDGLAGVQDARTALSQAIADRTDLPRRFTQDPAGVAVLIASTETLQGFADGLTQLQGGETAALPQIDGQKGNLPWPVQGTVLRKPGEADAAGITRPGVVMATRPRALVTTPTAATIRYSGPLLDLGLVTILEPQPGLMFVLAGLDATYGAAGEVLPAGSPIGLMGGQDPQIGAVLSRPGEGGGVQRSETLYIEVRQGKEPVDPLLWFGSVKD